MTPPPADTAPYVALIEAWLERTRAENPVVAAVDRDPDALRWYVRMRGEEKLVTTVWLTLGDRTISHETYFMPAPEENVAACYEYLLRVNARLFGTRFSIGPEDAIYLTGQVPLGPPDAGTFDDALDTIIGAAYAYSEECFRTAMRIGFASRFR